MHKHTQLLKEKKLGVSLTLWHISCHVLFGEKGVIKEKKKNCKYRNNLLPEDSVKRQKRVLKKNK